MWALAPEGWFQKTAENIPQGLKPGLFCGLLWHG